MVLETGPVPGTKRKVFAVLVSVSLMEMMCAIWALQLCNMMIQQVFQFGVHNVYANIADSAILSTFSSF